MPKKRTRTIAIVAGLGAAALVLALALNWRAVYYAIYPKERLYGRWAPVVGQYEAEGAAQRPVRAEITAVEIPREEEKLAATRIIVEARLHGGLTALAMGEPRTNSVKFGIRQFGSLRHRPDRIAFPNFFDEPTWSPRSRLDVVQPKSPSAHVRFRFDSDGRLILEHDEPFLPGGGKKLILERAPEGE